MTARLKRAASKTLITRTITNPTSAGKVPHLMKMGARSWSTTTAAASSSSSSSSGGSSSSVDSYSSSGPLCPPSSSSSSSSSPPPPSCLAVAVAAVCSHHHRRTPPPPQKGGSVLDSVTSKDLAVAVQRAERNLAVRRDLILDLPTCVRLPDGEELPYGASRHLRIRDSEQESEIRREFIRAPPNRIAPHPDVSQPPFRCYSEGILMKGHPTSSSSSCGHTKNKSSPSSILAVGSSNLFLDHHYNDEEELSRLLLDMDGQPIVTRSKSMSTGSSPASSRLEATVKSCVRSIKERLTGVETTPDSIRRRPSAPERTAAATSSSSSLVLANLPVLTCDSDEGSSSSTCLSSGK